MQDEWIREMKKRRSLASFRKNFVSERKGVFLNHIRNRKATRLLFQWYIYETDKMCLVNWKILFNMQWSLA